MKALAHLLPPLALAALLMSPAAMTVHAQASTLALLTVPCSTAGTYTSSKFNVTGDQWMEITVEGATAGGGHPLCVDVDGYGTTAGSQVWAYPCTRSDDPTKQNERWNYTASDGLIRSAFPGAASNNMCAGMVNGAGILTLQPCTSPSGVHWTHTADGQLQLMDTRGMTGLGESGADPVCMVAQNISNVGCGSGGAFSTAAWCNTSLPFAARADAILAEASLGEVTAMMGNANSGIPRLAIPTNAFSECLHGVLTGCGAAAGPDSTGCPTSFPSALGMGASFNTTMFADVATAIGTEGRALNNQGVAGLTYWAPDINLFRDPRWGRGQEVSGEDPFLMAEYARNYIKHLQGEDDDKFFRVISTPKHFSSYDLEQWCDKSVDPPVCADRMNFNAIVSARDQAEYFFPAFRAAVTEGHAQSMMCSCESRAIGGRGAGEACLIDVMLLCDATHNQCGRRSHRRPCPSHAHTHTRTHMHAPPHLSRQRRERRPELRQRRHPERHLPWPMGLRRLHRDRLRRHQHFPAEPSQHHRGPRACCGDRHRRWH